MAKPDAQQLFAKLQMAPHLFAQVWAAADVNADGVLSKQVGVESKTWRQRPRSMAFGALLVGCWVLSRKLACCTHAAGRSPAPTLLPAAPVFLNTHLHPAAAHSQEFCLFMYLLRKVQHGYPVPLRLTPGQATTLLGLVPPPQQDAAGLMAADPAASEHHQQPLKVDLARIKSALRPGSRQQLLEAPGLPLQGEQVRRGGGCTGLLASVAGSPHANGLPVWLHTPFPRLMPLMPCFFPCSCRTPGLTRMTTAASTACQSAPSAAWARAHCTTCARPPTFSATPCSRLTASATRAATAVGGQPAGAVGCCGKPACVLPVCCPAQAVPATQALRI